MSLLSGSIGTAPAFSVAPGVVLPLPVCLGVFAFMFHPSVSPLAVLSFRWGPEFLFLHLHNQTHWSARSSQWLLLFPAPDDGREFAMVVNDSFVCFDPGVCSNVSVFLPGADDSECYLSSSAGLVDRVVLDHLPWSVVPVLAGDPVPVVSIFPSFSPRSFVDLSVSSFLGYFVDHGVVFHSSDTYCVSLPVFDVLQNVCLPANVSVSWLLPDSVFSDVRVSLG